MISIKGLDKAQVLVALYNSSIQLGLGCYNTKGYNELTLEKAQELLKTQTNFDYFNGRVLKVNLSGDEIDETKYDRDNGQGAAKKIIDKLRSGEKIEINQEEKMNASIRHIINSIDDPKFTNAILGLIAHTQKSSPCIRYDVYGNPCYSEKEEEIEQETKKKYDRIIYLIANQGVYIVVKDEKYGAVSVTTGDEVVPCVFNMYCEAVEEWERLGYPLKSYSKER